MPTTMINAFTAAEERQETDRVKAQRRLALSLSVNAGKRAEVSEIVAAFTDKEIKRLVSIVESWRRAIDGYKILTPRDSEDAVQETIFELLKYPKGVDTTQPFQALIVWKAKGHLRNQMRNKAARPADSLDEGIGDEGAATLKDFIPFDDSRLQTLAVLEHWYVKVYVKDLMTRVSKSNLEIGTELGIKTSLVSAIRDELRAEQGLSATVATSSVWTKRTSLAALRYYADEHGVAPTREDLDVDPTLPPSRRLVTLFGSRLNAYKAAGLRLGGKVERFDESDKPEIAKRLVARADELGHWPSSTEMRDPTAIVVNRLFGTVAKRKLYDAARELLGEDAVADIAIPTAARRHTPLQRARVIADWADREGRWPGLRDFECDGSLPSRAVVQKRYGSVKVEKVRLAVLAVLDRE